MVQLVEVEDEHFQGVQPGPDEDDGDFTDTDSEISADSDFDPEKESLVDRILALKDIIPPTTRGWISSRIGFGVRFVQNFWYYGSRTIWVLSATSLMIVMPLAVCVTEDQQIEAMEREFKMREMGGELLTAGVDGEGDTAERVSQALGRADAKASL